MCNIVSSGGWVGVGGIAGAAAKLARLALRAVKTRGHRSSPKLTQRRPRGGQIHLVHGRRRACRGGDTANEICISLYILCNFFNAVLLRRKVGGRDSDNPRAGGCRPHSRRGKVTRLSYTARRRRREKEEEEGEGGVGGRGLEVQSILSPLRSRCCSN